MTQTTPERKPCGTCGEEYTVTAAGGMRHHFTENPDFQAGPDSRKCKGVGQPPTGATAPSDAADGPQCRLCKHPVQLTDNGRARSHLTPEQTPRECPAGSDFPLGMYPDVIGTTDGRVATISFDCDHREVGACYDCYAEAGNPDDVAPTMADQLKGTPLTQALARETQGVGTVLDAMDGDTRAEAERFMATVADQRRRIHDSIPLLNRGEAAPATHTGRPSMHSGGSPDPHAYEAAAAIATVEADQAEVERQHAETLTDVRRRAYPDGKYCEKCDTDTHRCPGCGTDVPHGTVACGPCNRETCTHPDGFQDTADDLDEDGQDRVVSTCTFCGAVDPEDELTDNEPVDAWRTPDDLLALMPENVRGLDALRLNCRTCGHSVTPLVEAFDLYGKAKAVLWVCEQARHAGALSCDNGGHECKPNTRVRLGELDEGDHFTRRGTLMRVTGETNGVVEAVVVEGPHKGRTGELPNLGETVDREPCRHNFSYGDDGKFGHSGTFCDYCGTEQETKECTDDRMPQQRPASSAASARTTTNPTTAPAPGSKPPSPKSAPAVSPKLNPVTSSAPTAKAAGNGRSAAVTADQASAAAAFLGSGSPAAPVTNGSTNQAEAAAQFLAGGSGAHGEKETKRDRYGRYLIPHPDTGKEKAWTRATTFAKSISDTYALGQWGLRMCLLGATVRPDIVQRAHGKHVKADKQLLDELTADLKNAAGDKVAANLGTSMHSFTEMADRAWHSPGGPRSVLGQVPPDCREMVETYIRLLEETGLEPVPHLIEFTTVVKQYGVAGTSDNCYKVTKPLTLKIGRAEVRLNPGEYVIGDKKTGKDLDYGWQEIVIQLATYAQGINTAGVWDRHNERWEPDPLSRFDAPGTKVRLDAGVVIHLPVDKEAEKTPAVYGVDLESGWNAAVLCERVRAWRNVRNLASPVMVSEPSRPDPAVTTRTNVRPPSLRDKANAVTSKGEASAVWQEAKQAGTPDTEVDELVALMQARLKKLAEPGG